jgi:pimeloyl-ACP methyl ester carboxylesterase
MMFRFRLSVVFMLSLACTVGPGANIESGQSPLPVSDQSFVPLKPAVLGHAIGRLHGVDEYCLVVDEQVVQVGSLEACEQALADSLIAKYGRGHGNIKVPTLGGLQLWADVYWHAGWKIQEHVYSGHFRLLDAHNVRHAWGTWEQCRAVFEQLRVGRKLPPAKAHLVVLLHGLGRAGASFSKMSKALQADGFGTASLIYPSTRRSLNEHASQLEHLLNQLEGVEKVSFVTHSLGGLVVRKLLARESASWTRHIQLGRVVMLAPPSQGSKVAETLKDFLPYSWLVGPSGQDVSASEVGEEQLPPPPCEFAIIAGGKGDGEGWNPLLPGDDDGVISVDEARLDGASHFFVVKRLHTFIMVAPEVIAATGQFLTTGEM